MLSTRKNRCSFVAGSSLSMSSMRFITSLSYQEISPSQLRKVSGLLADK
ncbi:hypothetical protein [Chryseobacterium hispalense]|nr:hypothetical protein [Chryseobacterium hispalense]